MKKLLNEEKFYSSDLELMPYQIYLMNFEREKAYTLIDSKGIRIYLPMNCSFQVVIESLLHEMEEIYWLVNKKRFFNTKSDPSYESIENIYPVLYKKWKKMNKYNKKNKGE